MLGFEDVAGYWERAFDDGVAEGVGLEGLGDVDVAGGGWWDGFG